MSDYSTCSSISADSFCSHGSSTPEKFIWKTEKKFCTNYTETRTQQLSVESFQFTTP